MPPGMWKEGNSLEADLPRLIAEKARLKGKEVYQRDLTRVGGSWCSPKKRWTGPGQTAR